jgi:nickel superoxide dismutase
MRLTDRALAAVERLLPADEASAHCDIPCGIYDPHTAQIAALTVIRMFQLIEALPEPGANASKAERDLYSAQISRYTAVKEEHAKLCEHELIILWTDYFRPEHLEKHSNLHDVVWKTTKLCSTVKQQMNMQAAQDLLAGCQQIAEIFWDTKGVKTRRQPSNQTAGGELVYPVAG